MFVSARPAPWVASMAVHGLALSLVFVVRWTVLPEPSPVAPNADRIPLMIPLRLAPAAAAGGGGATAQLPVSRGEAPRVQPKRFTLPPQAEPRPDPPLILDAAIDLPANAQVPVLNAAHWGNPFATAGPPSSGPGCCSGIGNAPKGTGGIGDGPGRSFAPGGAKGAYAVGGGVSAPIPVFRPEPEYSEEARKAKYQGMVTVEIVVDPSGIPRDFRVINSAGLGLDEKAVEAVSRWRFRPARKDGKAVPVRASIEVHFRLL